MSFDPLHPHSRPFRRLLWKGAGLLTALLVTIAVAGPALSRPENAAPPMTWGGDFLVAYAAGTLAREGRFEEMHDTKTFIRRIRGIADENNLPGRRGEVGPWLNPPFYLWPFTQLSRLPYPLALAAWNAISFAAAAMACWLLWRMLTPRPPLRHPKLHAITPPPDWRSWALVPVLVLLSMPALQTFTHGQSSAVSLLILAATVTLWRKKNAFLAGAALGLLFYKPQLALVVAAVLTLDLGRRALLGLVLTGALLALLSAILMPQELALYIQHSPSAAAMMQLQGVFPWHRHATFTAFWRLLFQGMPPGQTAGAVVMLGAGSALLLVGPLFWRLARHRRPALLAPPRADLRAAAQRRDRLIAATVTVMPLAMPYYMDYDLLLLAVPAVLFAADAGQLKAMSPGDHWTRRAWVALYVWLYPSAGFAATTGVNLNVVFLALVATGMVWRSFTRGTGVSVERSDMDESMRFAA